jgi:hypothetical protein
MTRKVKSVICECCDEIWCGRCETHFGDCLCWLCWGCETLNDDKDEACVGCGCERPDWFISSDDE